MLNIRTLSCLFIVLCIQNSWAGLPPSSAKTDYVTISSDNSASLPNIVAGTINKDNIAMVGYFQDGKLVLAVCADEACSSMTKTEIATPASPVQVDLDSGPQGYPVIAFGNAITASLKLAICTDLLCTSPQIIDYGRFPEYFSLGVKENGVPVISFSDLESSTKSGLSLAICSNPACTQKTIKGITNTGTLDSSGKFNDIAFGSSGFPIISYLDKAEAALMLAICNDDLCASRTIKTIDDFTVETGWSTSLAVNDAGLAFISYIDITKGTLRLANCTNVQCTGISYQTVDSNTPDTFFFTDIQLANDRFPVISYFDYDQDKLKILKCNNFTCFAPEISVIEQPALGENTLMLNKKGDPVIAYATAKAVKLATCNLCFLPKVEILDNDNVEALYPSLKISPAGLPVVSYFDEVDVEMKLAICLDANCRNSTIRPLKSHSGLNSSLDFGPDGLPVIAFTDASNDSLSLAFCNNQLCDDPNYVVVDDSTRGFFNDLKFRNGIPYISYSSGLGSKDLKLAFCSNSTCSAGITKIVLDGQNSNVGIYTSLAFTSANAPVVSYYDETNGALKLVICDDPACAGKSIKTLDNTKAETGKFTSLAITKADIPLISYYNHTDSNLRLLVCLDPTCGSRVSDTIDAEGDVGVHSSISLTEDDLPVVSYVDRTNKAIKIITCELDQCGFGDTGITITTIFDTGDSTANIYNSLALDNKGYPRVSYIIDNVLKIAVFSETGELFSDSFE